MSKRPGEPVAVAFRKQDRKRGVTFTREHQELFDELHAFVTDLGGAYDLAAEVRVGFEHRPEDVRKPFALRSVYVDGVPVSAATLAQFAEVFAMPVADRL